MVCLCGLIGTAFWASSILIAIALVYSYSRIARYYIQMTGYYLAILTTAFICCFYAIPSYFNREGGSRVFSVFRFLSRWMDINVELRNRKKLESDVPYVLISNHQSSLDVFAMAHTWPEQCTCMMKDSLKYIPGFNFACVLAHAIFVKRSSREGGITALKQCSSVMKEKNLKVWVFPEGTRNREKGMLPFKKGAFNLAVQGQFPIVPVVISDYTPFYSKGDKYFKPGGEMIIEVLDPIPTKGLTLDDVPDLSDQVRAKMLEVYERVTAEAAERFKKMSGSHLKSD
uniref:1-acyl-sn-glycerol-3-phosphate acyltransferase n=1 Tax=Steinernema glaseri TaxID=37863 RepID=A0A1I7Z2L5_9BILA